MITTSLAVACQAMPSYIEVRFMDTSNVIMILSYADACLAMPSHSKKHPHVRNGNKFVDEDSELLRRRSLSLVVAFCGTPSQIARYK